MDIKILVATHKKYWMPADSIYCPILLGAALREEDFGYQRDDEGDNISHKQPNYSDISALYWGWKNLQCEYFGLCHYRRYLSCSTQVNNAQGRKDDILHRKDCEAILQKYDMILPTKLNFGKLSVKEQYEQCHYLKDLRMAYDGVQRLYPGMEKIFDRIMSQHEMYACNLFVMKKDVADEYCKWLFPILFDIEKRDNIKDYDEYQSRVLGYLAERLFNVWLATKNVKIYEANIVLLGESYWDDKKFRYRVKNFFKDKIQKIYHKK